MDWFDEIEARGYTNDLTPDDVYRLIAEVRTLRADLARVTAERDAAIHDLQGVCNGECSGDPGAGWPACELWMYGEPDEHGHPTRGHCKYAPPHNYIGEEPVGPQEVTARLEKSMSESPIRTDPAAAREFLSRLSMYDENGLLREALFDEPQEAQDESN